MRAGTTTPLLAERRTQIKLTATPSRRAVPAMIAAATDEGNDGRIALENVDSGAVGSGSRAVRDLLGFDGCCGRGCT